MTVSDEEREALLKELAACNEKIDDAYWSFSRCARANPPILVCPEAYARRAEIEERLGLYPKRRGER